MTRFSFVLAGVGIFISVALSAGRSDKAARGDQYIKMEVKGILRTGIVAIGGETTGTQIKSDNVTLELDFGKDSKLAAHASRLDGKTVVVGGTLEVRPGVEVKQRWIVQVTSLKSS